MRQNSASCPFQNSTLKSIFRLFPMSGQEKRILSCNFLVCSPCIGISQEATNSRKKVSKSTGPALSRVNLVSEGFGKEFHSSNSVKRSGQFGELPDSEEWISLHSPVSLNSRFRGSGQVRRTEICNFGAPSPLEALHWIFWFFSSIYVQFSKTSPLKSGESSEKSCGENRVKSCHVCGCHGFFGPERLLPLQYWCSWRHLAQFNLILTLF